MTVTSDCSDWTVNEGETSEGLSPTLDRWHVNRLLPRSADLDHGVLGGERGVQSRRTG
jgi:hypothetical protein